MPKEDESRTLKLEPKDTPKPELKIEKPVDDGLVPMTNGTQTLRVHPTCVKDHMDNGWSL